MSNGTFPFAEISATAGADRLLINHQTQGGGVSASTIACAGGGQR